MYFFRVACYSVGELQLLLLLLLLVIMMLPPALVGAPSRKGSVVNGQTTKASNERAKSTPSPALVFPLRRCLDRICTMCPGLDRIYVLGSV